MSTGYHVHVGLYLVRNSNSGWVVLYHDTEYAGFTDFNNAYLFATVASNNGDIVAQGELGKRGQTIYRIRGVI